MLPTNIFRLVLPEAHSRSLVLPVLRFFEGTIMKFIALPIAPRAPTDGQWFESVERESTESVHYFIDPALVCLSKAMKHPQIYPQYRKNFQGRYDC